MRGMGWGDRRATAPPPNTAASAKPANIGPKRRRRFPFVGATAAGVGVGVAAAAGSWDGAGIVAASLSALCSLPFGSTWTGARNRYPRRGIVSMNTGMSAESPSASRRRLIAVFRLVSKSTKVSTGHSAPCSSSRVTRTPAVSRSLRRTRKGCSCRRSFTPLRRSSADRVSSSKVPNRYRTDMADTPCGFADMADSDAGIDVGDGENV